MSPRDAATKARNESAKVRIKDALLDLPGRRFTLADLATAGGCTEAAASARWREIAKEWEGQKHEVKPGVWLYWLTGYRALSFPRPSPRNTELAELRARVERLEASLSSLSGGGR